MFRKHLIFIVLMVGISILLQQFVLDAVTGQFVLISAIFWTLMSSFILYFSVAFGKDAQPNTSTSILLGGLVAKFLSAIFFFLVYVLYTKHASMGVGISFVAHSFLFTSWVLYHLITFFNQKDQFESRA